MVKKYKNIYAAHTIWLTSRLLSKNSFTGPMYESLLCLPYFQGMSKDDITAILGKVTLEFKRYGDGDVIFRRGEKCDKFIILTQGKVTGTATAPDKSYSISEELYAPMAIEPHSIFGYSTCYQRDYTAKGDCTLLFIDKQHIFGELSKHNIFTINLLNIICRRTQQMDERIWNYNSTTLHGRIVQFIANHCERQKGEKHISVKMERLAALLCETRLNISKALNDMQDAGHLSLHRGGITIHAIERLLKDYE